MALGVNDNMDTAVANKLATDFTGGSLKIYDGAVLIATCAVNGTPSVATRTVTIAFANASVAAGGPYTPDNFTLCKSGGNVYITGSSITATAGGGDITFDSITDWATGGTVAPDDISIDCSSLAFA